MPSSLPFPGYYAKNQVWQAGQKFTTHAGTKVTIDWISDTAAGVTIDTLPAGKPLLVSPGDFNGDGIADLVMRRPNGDLWFSPGDGWGKYLAGQKIGSGWQIYDHVIGTGDFNGDGINDHVSTTVPCGSTQAPAQFPLQARGTGEPSRSASTAGMLLPASSASVTSTATERRTSWPGGLTVSCFSTPAWAPAIPECRSRSTTAGKSLIN
jgi:hypothetical protein